MLDWPLVSVIILNYNGRKNLGLILKNCIASVLDINYPNFEVLFVDNASTDGSADFIEKVFGQNPRLRLIRNEKNFGFAEGNNVGIRNAKAEYIALLNSDTKVDPKWLKELVTSAQQDCVGAVQSKILQMNSPGKIDCAGGFVDYYGYHFERGRGEKASSYNRQDEIFYAKGAGVMFKREILKKTGLFDSDIFIYFDETDLCWRIWLSGYKVLFAPKSIVYHASGSTTSALQTQKRSYFYMKNHLLVLIKNFGLENLFTSGLATLLYETRTASLFLARRKPLVSYAMLSALVWNLLHLKPIWKKRQLVQALREVSDDFIKKKMLPPCPPFPLYLVFSRSRYLKRQILSGKE